MLEEQVPLLGWTPFYPNCNCFLQHYLGSPKLSFWTPRNSLFSCRTLHYKFWIITRLSGSQCLDKHRQLLEEKVEFLNSVESRNCQKCIKQWKWANVRVILSWRRATVRIAFRLEFFSCKSASFTQSIVFKFHQWNIYSLVRQLTLPHVYLHYVIVSCCWAHAHFHF